MLVIISKIKNKIGIYRVKTRLANPEYSRGQWVLKCVLLGSAALTYELVGFKIHDIELNLYYGKIMAYGVDYVFLLGVQGLMLGLCVWRLLEVYWWAKNRIE